MSLCELVGKCFACEGGFAGVIDGDVSGQGCLAFEIISVYIATDGVIKGCA